MGWEKTGHANNLLEFFEKVMDAIDKAKPFDCIYLNFAKVFDKVPHLSLITKLNAHGVHGNVAKWISFLG